MLGLARRTKSRGQTPDLNESPQVRGSRSRWWWLLGLVVLVAGSVGVTLATGENLSKSAGTITLTGAAKTFELADVREGLPPVRLADYAGQPVVLNFFGSWCPPCLRELPDLQAIAERFEGRVAVVGVTFQDTRDKAREVLRRSGVTYPAAWDPDDDVGLAYALRAMPTTVFISPDGQLLERAERELSERQLESIIERLFF